VAGIVSGVWKKAASLSARWVKKAAKPYYTIVDAHIEMYFPSTNFNK
jgi:hypothetical protein